MWFGSSAPTAFFHNDSREHRFASGYQDGYQEGNMAPKPKSKPARFVFAVAMALTILAVMT